MLSCINLVVGGIENDGMKNQSRGRIVIHGAGRNRALGQTVYIKQKKGAETDYLVRRRWSGRVRTTGGVQSKVRKGRTGLRGTIQFF